MDPAGELLRTFTIMTNSANADMAHLHDRLDEAVAAAYGWPAALPAAEIVARVVALNAQRRAEEAEGLVRWLRPDFQAPEEVHRAATQTTLNMDEAPTTDAIQ